MSKEIKATGNISISVKDGAIVIEGDFNSKTEKLVIDFLGEAAGDPDKLKKKIEDLSGGEARQMLHTLMEQIGK